MNLTRTQKLEYISTEYGGMMFYTIRKTLGLSARRGITQDMLHSIYIKVDAYFEKYPEKWDKLYGKPDLGYFLSTTSKNFVKDYFRGLTYKHGITDKSIDDENDDGLKIQLDDKSEHIRSFFDVRLTIEDLIDGTAFSSKNLSIDTIIRIIGTAKINRLLMELNPIQYDVLYNVYAGDQTFKEYADEHDVKLTTVLARAYQGKRILARKINMELTRIGIAGELKVVKFGRARTIGRKRLDSKRDTKI